jgi:hypothetical protein
VVADVSADDTEAVVSEWLALASEVWPRCVPVSEGEIEALRALLLDYQERGRALEWIATTDFLPAKSASPWSTTENENDMGMGIVAIQERARATLKGKSHD